jgi:hypothetical protein
MTSEPKTTCPTLDRVDRHFSGALGSGDEAQLRRHLPECAECRERYRAHLLVERLDPRAAGPKARLARALGLRPRRRWGLWLGVPMAAMATAAVVLFIGTGNGFVARGGAGPAALQIYRAGAERLVEASMRAGDELAFAYRNPARKKFLLVFGVDEHQHVFWYHPAWVSAADEPVAIPIAVDAALHELPEAIAQPLDGRELRMTAWFLDEPLSVKAAEALIAQHKQKEGAVVVQRPLRVEPR